MDKSKNNFNDINKTLNYLHPNGSTFEVCCIDPQNSKLDLWGGKKAWGNKPIVAGWFSDHSVATEIISKLDQRAEAEGVYITLNPCNPDLMARANGRLKVGVGRTKDNEIEQLQNLLIDVDSKRLTGISATEKEKNAAISVAKKIRQDLENSDWHEPLVGDSGNGGHLIYKIDLPNTPENVQLLKRVLAALDQKYSTESVEIDTKVSNPSRMTKAYGTTARKGDSTPERPHRRSKILQVPDDPKPVSINLLEKLAAQFQEEIPAQNSSNESSVYNRLDIPAYLEHYGVKSIKKKPNGSSMLYVLEHCLFNPEHKGGESAIGQTAEGKLFYLCFHNSCKDKTWNDARKKISRDDPLYKCRGGYNNATGEVSAKQIDPPNCFLPKPESFPIEVLPDTYGLIVEQAAKAFAVPLVVPACALLSMSGACIGRSRGLRIKPGWVECGNLFMAIVAKSGMGKSPATTAIFNSIFRVEKNWFEEFQTAQQRYNAEIDARKKSPKKDELTPPDAPIWKQIFVDDATVESLTDALHGNPGGILWYRDELSGLILELDKYGGKDGGTKARLMSAYDCGPWKTNRINKGRVNYIQNACLSIFGTIQPGALHQIFNDLDAATGFLPRFLFVRATQENPPVWTDESFGTKHEKELDRLVDKLLAMDLLPSGKPKCIDVQNEAKSLYTDWFDRQACKPWVDFDSQAFEALSAKIRGQCLRLCLILHCLHSIEEGRKELVPVSVDTMKKAIILADWFSTHQRQVWQIIGKRGQVSEISPLEKRVVAAIVELETEIQNETLPTARITEKINESASEQFKVTSRSVGRTCTALGLERRKTSTHRLRVISERKMEEFKSTIKNATNATNATSSEKSIVCEDGNNILDATNAIDKSGISGITKKNDTAVKPRQIKLYDISGISGVSSGSKQKLNMPARPDEVEV